MARSPLSLVDTHWRRNLAILGGAYLVLIVLDLGIEAFMMRPGAPFEEQLVLAWTQILLVLFWLASLLLLPLVLIPIALVRLALPAASGRVPALVLFMIVVVGTYLLLDLGAWRREVRRIGLRSFAARAEPVIQAIHRYEADHGNPPTTLAELVPDYLSVAPLALLQLRACKRAQYRVWRQHRNAYQPRWQIEFACPNTGILTLDRLYYASNAVYPLQPARPAHEYYLRWVYVWD